MVDLNANAEFLLPRTRDARSQASPDGRGVAPRDTRSVALLTRADGMSRAVPVREPLPTTIIERVSVPDPAVPDRVWRQRRFGFGGFDASGAPHYVESELAEATFRCGGCGSSPELAYLPHPADLRRGGGALPTGAGGVGWLLCWRCFATWSRSAPVRPSVRRVSTPRATAGEAIGKASASGRRAPSRPQQPALRSGFVPRFADRPAPHVARVVDALSARAQCTAPPGCPRMTPTAASTSASAGARSARVELPEGCEEVIRAILVEVDPCRLRERGGAAAYADQALALRWQLEGAGGLAADGLAAEVARAFGRAERTPPDELPDELRAAYACAAERILAALAPSAGALAR